MSTGNSNSAAAPPKKGLVPPRFKPYLAPVLISFILLVGELKYGILESYWHTGLAILASIVLELVLGKWATGKWPHLASAYITGISVGILVRSTHLWPYVVCSLLSISSKYALRVHGRHLWNPSNLGVSLLLLLAPVTVSPLSDQFGNGGWPLVIIIALGSLILYTLGRLHISLTYVVAFTLLSFLRSGLTDSWWVSEIALLTQPSYQLFIFFMITDPKTTTRTWRRQCVVAVLVAVVETALRLNREIHAPYYALFIVAPVTNLIEIWWESRRAKAALPEARPAAGPPSNGADAAPRAPSPVSASSPR